MKLLLAAALIFLAPLIHAAELKVASLHPLLTGLCREIGGSAVETIDLLGPNGDPHKFEPRPDDLRRATGAKLYIVSGMGLESYLPSLRGILGKDAKILEVGATLPALEGTCEHEHEDGHHHHHEHETDPHWWHSIDLYRRAVTIVTEELSHILPEKSPEFQSRGTQIRARLDELERWAKREIAKIPRANRHLATAHAAFNYFCQDFGFTARPVQGLNREQVPSAAALSALISELRKKHVTAIFPEKQSNPKILQTLTRDTGIRLGPPLNADGTGTSSYEEMMRANITAIVATLAPDP